MAILRRVQLQSRIASNDARLIEDDEGSFGSKIYLDPELYVTRTVEQSIYKHILRTGNDVAPSVFVVGEVGHGKTSLLWNVHRTWGKPHTRQLKGVNH